MGWKEEDDEVEVLEAGWSMVATGIIRRDASDRRGREIPKVG